MFSDAMMIPLATATVGVLLGFVLSRVSDWFENRAEADTPEDDKWELYTLLTFFNKNGPVTKDSKKLVLSAKSLNRLSIASMNSTKDSNNYRPTLTLRQYREAIIPNLRRQNLIEVVDESRVSRRLYRLGRNKLRYRITDNATKLIGRLIDEYEDLLNDKQRDDNADILEFVHINPLDGDKIRSRRWDEISHKIGNLDLDFADDPKSKKSEEQRLTRERDTLTAEVWTCEAWLIRQYRERVNDKLKRQAQEDSLESPDISAADVPDTTWYVIRGRSSGVLIEAWGYFATDSQEFWVVSDEESGKMSYASKAEAPSISPSYHDLREKLQKPSSETGDGPVLVPDDDQSRLRFARKRRFSSSSQASSVVLGRVSSGPREWREVTTAEGTKADVIYVLKGKRRDTPDIVEARGCGEESGFVVKEGSFAFVNETDSIPAVYSRIRAKLVNENVLKRIPGSDDKYEFRRDYTFRSSSQASSVVLGRASSGPREWRHKDNPSQRLGDATP